eukprot:m.203361 g.203361  ORF g.203361 m.203361 type:complete len:123 (+) comp14990_c0_seq5:3683-4051(+)
MWQVGIMIQQRHRIHVSFLLCIGFGATLFLYRVHILLGGELPVDASDHHSRQETVRDTPSSPFEAIKFTALTHSTPIADGLRSQPARRGRSVVSSIHEPQQLQSELQRSFMSALDAAEHLPD